MYEQRSAVALENVEQLEQRRGGARRGELGTAGDGRVGYRGPPAELAGSRVVST